MKLPEQTKGIEVFYDGRCGMCCTFHEWINRQPREFGIDLIAYQSARAELVFPGIGTLDPAREMVVRTDRGEIFPRCQSMGDLPVQLLEPPGRRAEIGGVIPAAGRDPRLPRPCREPPFAQQGLLPQQGQSGAGKDAPNGNARMRNRFLPDEISPRPWTYNSSKTRSA